MKTPTLDDAMTNVIDEIGCTSDRAYIRSLLTRLVDDFSLKTGVPTIDDLIAECITTLRVKGADYTIGSTDKLANFNRGADFFGARPAQVLGIYLWKHVTAIFNFIKSDGQAESEPIRGRIVDVINYMLLFWLMVSEEK